MMARAWQHLKATNDEDGGPQRLYMVYELEEYEGDDARYNYWKLVEVYDEGYGGRPMDLQYVPRLPDVDISTTVYELTLSMADAVGIKRYGA